MFAKFLKEVVLAVSPGMYEAQARPTNEAQVLLGSASEAPPSVKNSAEELGVIFTV